MNYKIPFNKPFIVGKELYYISQSVLRGKIAGDGIFTQKCQQLLEKKFRSKMILLTHSCTAALEMAAILCNVEEGDEVIMPSFTFVSTANAFYLRKAKINFIDIRTDTLNIDEEQIETTINKRTKVIVPVHYAGVPCAMDKIMNIARKYRLYVVEDAAQGVNSKYKNKYLGTIGDIGAYSFHETKNIICGEGGAIALNNEQFVERAETIRDKGTNRKKFFRGEIDKYTWVDIGSSYLLSDLLAAFLYAQLENMDEINAQRQNLVKYYYNNLKILEHNEKIKLPSFPNSKKSNNHIFYILLNNQKTRNKLMAYLKKKGILAVFHYIPLHVSPVGRSMGYKNGQLPNTESISGRLLRLPLYYGLTKNEQDYIIDSIIKFFK